MVGKCGCCRKQQYGSDRKCQQLDFHASKSSCSILIGGQVILCRHEILGVLFVIVAEIFEEFGKSLCRLYRVHISSVSPRFAVILRIDHSDLVVQRILRSTGDPLDEMNVGGM